MLNQADSITSQVNPDPGTNSPGTPICKPPAYIHGIAAHMQERLRYWQMDVQKEIAKVMQEYQTMQSIADTYKRQADTFNAQVATAFGKPVASRVAGRMWLIYKGKGVEIKVADTAVDTEQGWI